MSLELVKVIGGKSIRARECDRYVNATELCKAAGKLWADYRRLAGTEAFLEALSRSMGFPIDLIQSTKNGPNGSRGTWIHPRVVIHFAQWASAEFAAAVTGWVLELLTTGKVELGSPTPTPTITITSEQFERLVGRVEHLQRQLDRWAEIAPLAITGPVVPATPRTTVQERLRIRGWTEANAKQRALIRKQANIWLMLRFGETPDVSGGPGAPCVYFHHQVAVLDEAIDYVRSASLKCNIPTKPHLFSDYDRKAG